MERKPPAIQPPAPAAVTGETITDEQIREVRDAVRGTDFDMFRVASQALEWVECARDVAERALRNPGAVDIAQIKIMAERILGREWERARCAVFINVRNGVQP